MSVSKKNAESGVSALAVLIILFVVVGGAVAMLYTTGSVAPSNTEVVSKPDANAEQAVVEIEAEVPVEQADEADAPSQDVSGASKEEQGDVAPDVVVETQGSFDLEAASKPRILGNPDAPIKISEHSSFTCNHCAHFHESNFKKIKKDYIDTGKAYLVFDDFPRNQFDLLIGAVARCVPEQAYFNFVQLLFETQDTWLKDDYYVEYVKQNAQLAGASQADIQMCLDSKELKEALAQHQNDAHNNNGVKSTPTLVINDSVLIPGLSPYNEIKAALDKALESKAQ